jgi:hypothetical protein
VIWGQREEEYFFGWGWTRASPEAASDLPVGQKDPRHHLLTINIYDSQSRAIHFPTMHRMQTKCVDLNSLMFWGD